jgi:hypothetical protein
MLLVSVVINMVAFGTGWSVNISDDWIGEIKVINSFVSPTSKR